MIFTSIVLVGLISKWFEGIILQVGKL